MGWILARCPAHCVAIIKIIMDEDILVQLDTEDIVRWVIMNRDNRQAIDEINKVTFPFTTKYLGTQTNKGNGGF